MTLDRHRNPDWLDLAKWPWPPRWVDVGDGSLHTIDVGQGPIVLLVHGTPTSGYDYRHLVADLSRDHRVIVPDHLGFGFSDRPRAADYRPEAHARRLEAFVDAMALDRFALVVHDFGGPIGLPLAMSGRAVRVALLNTFFWPIADEPMVGMGALLLGSAFGRWLYERFNFSIDVLAASAWGTRSPRSPELWEHHRRLFQEPSDRGLVLHALAASMRGSRAHFESLWQQRRSLDAMPMALIWGMADHAFRPDHLDKVAAEFPRAAVTRIEGAGHWPHEEAPAEVLAALRKWLHAVD